jgi:hypothetical protein
MILRAIREKIRGKERTKRPTRWNEKMIERLKGLEGKEFELGGSREDELRD